MPKIIATKKDWILLGYKLFAENGIKGLVVEKMAKKLKVNKSSFYWHFKTKKDFVDEIIAYWVSTETDKIIATSGSEQSGKDKFDKLIELVFKKQPSLDFIFFLKRYGSKNKKIETLITNVDNQRVEYTKNILIEMGFSSNDAKIKSQLFYKYLIGYHVMLHNKNQSKDYTTEVKKELNQFIKF